MAHYDVFLNHRGEVKGHFVSHLYDALISVGSNPFLDMKCLEKGGHIQDNIKEAVKGAQVHVAVVSTGYVESKSCLNELTQIMDSRRVDGKRVIPVFYDVEPADLRRVQKDPFAAAFQKHKKRESPEQVKKWVEALQDLADLYGFYLADYKKDEAVLVRLIVAEVKKYLPHLSQQIVSAVTEERHSYYQAQAPPAQSNSRIVDQGCRCRPGSSERSGPQQFVQNQTIVHGNVYINRNRHDRDDGNIVEGMTSMNLREPAYSAPAYPILAPSGSRMQQSFVEEVEDYDSDESLCDDFSMPSVI